MAAVSATNSGFGSIRENLFTDPNNTNAATWNVYPGGGGGLSVSISASGTPYVGTTATSVGHSYPATQNIVLYSPAMAVTAGQNYVASTYFRNTSTALTGHLAMQWYVDGAWQGFWYKIGRAHV